MVASTVTAVGLATVSASCSFLVDFPDVASGGSAATGQSVGSEPQSSSSSSTGAGACATPGTATFGEVAWQGKVTAATSSDEVAITGLAREIGRIHAFGAATSPVDGLSLGSTLANVAFSIQVDDAGTVTQDGAIDACYNADQVVLTSRMTLHDNGGVKIPLVSGGVKPDPTSDAKYTFVAGPTDSCDASEHSLDPSASTMNPSVPFFGVFADGVGPDMAFSSAGRCLDIGSTGDYDGGIAVAQGLFFNAPSSSVLRYFLDRTPSTSSTHETIPLAARADPTRIGARLPVYGGVTLEDVDSTQWGTGMDCANPDACTDAGAVFLSRWPTGASQDTPLPITQSGNSFGSTVRHGGGLVVVGGGYRGSLAMNGSALPDTTTTDAFVVALAGDSQEVVWTYPSASVHPSHDTSRFDAVVDLAVVFEGAALGDSCGAVYVAGCVADEGTGQTCLDAGPGKQGFLTKLDLASGAEIWTTPLVTDDAAAGMMLPTAIAADASGVWLAATVGGTLQLPDGSSATTGAGRESLLLRFEP